MKMLKAGLRKCVNALGYDIYNRSYPTTYSQDGLSTNHNHSFIDDPDFQAAYARAIRANDGVDHKMHWRAHVAFWAASQAVRLPGDVVECGVNTGFLMSGIMQKTGWNTLRKTCYLFDTFQGLKPEYVSDHEARDGRLQAYQSLSEQRTRQNFAEFDRVEFIVGAVPDSLDQVDIPKVCYLSLDMNCTIPEIAAFRHFWPRMVPGGWVVLDDYAYSGFEQQHHAYNALSKEIGFDILTLPTGQGLVQKPPLAG